MARMFTAGCIGDFATFKRTEFGNERTTGPLSRVSSGAIIRSGEKFAMQCTGLVSGSAKGMGLRVLTTVVDTDTYYYRVFLKVETRPSADNWIMYQSGTGTGGIGASLRFQLNSDGSVDFTNNTTVLYTSAVLTLDQWYCFEWSHNRATGASDGTVVLKIDGTQVYSSSTLSLNSSYRELWFGGNLSSETQTTGSWYFASIVVNDSTGASNNTWVGHTSQLTYLLVDTGETPTYDEPTANGAGSNEDVVNTDAPGDGSSVYSNCSSNSGTWGTSGSRFLTGAVSAASAGIGASDTISGMSIGVTWACAAGSTSGTIAGYKSGGSIFDVGSALTITDTSPRFIDDSFVISYPWQTVDASDSAAWTPAKLDAIEIGYRATDTSPNAKVVGLWAIVEYEPVAAGASLPPVRSLAAMLPLLVR